MRLTQLTAITLILMNAARVDAAAEMQSRNVSSHAGYAVLDVPEARRSFISGPVMSLALSRDGALLVGSTRLAVFDGRSWERVEVPGAVRILALAADPGAGPERVWFAGEGSLGFVERTRTGRWHATVMNPHLVAAGIADVTDVRQIVPDGRGGALFVARSKIVRWNGVAMNAWEMPNPNRLWSFVHEGKLHAHQLGVGIWRVEADGPVLWIREDALPVRQPLISLVSTGDGELAVFYEDLFRRVGDQWQHVPGTGTLFKGRRAMHVERVADDMIAVGTAYGGVFLCRNDGTLAGVVNGQNGLADDNIDVLLRDHDGSLWIGTGTGLARLSGAGRVSQFDQRARLSHGFVRRVVNQDDRPLVITSRRAYHLIPSAPTEPARFGRIETLWPQLREGIVHRGTLWLGGTGGLWRVENEQAMQEPAATADVFLVAAPRLLPEAVLYFTRTEAFALLESDGTRRSVPMGIRLESLPYSLAEDGAGRIWVSTRDGHVRVFAIERAPLRLAEIAHFAPGSGVPASLQRSLLTTLGGEVFLTGDREVLRSGGTMDGFRPVEELAEFSAEAAVQLPDGTAYWSVQHRRLGSAAPHALIRVERLADGSLKWAPVDAPGLDHIGDVTSLSVTEFDGRTALWVGGENALLRIEDGALHEAVEVAPVHLNRIRAGGIDESLARRTRAEFPGDASPIEFAYATRTSTTAGHLFETRLLGVEAGWAPPSFTPRREFTGLASGRYEMQVRAVDRWGRPGPVASYAFALPPPWYLRGPAVAAWIALLAAVVAALLSWRLRHLRRQTDRLNELVNERTRELSLSNTAKSELLESLSHEIRRPLNGIVSLINRLDPTGLTNAQREHARLLARASESLSRAFDELLNFSQLDYGTVKVESRPFSLRDVIDRVLCDHAADRRPPAVTFAPDFVDGFVGDDLKLDTIIGNFVANALKYAGSAPSEIHVSATASPVDGVVDVLVEVSDGGPGIPEEEQELIFKRFVRGSHAKVSGIPGTGIGLATCRGMARLLGGSVGVESPAERARQQGWPGPGATFFVRIPLRRRAARSVQLPP